MRLFPILGLDNTSHDDQLTVTGDSSGFFMRNIVNFDISKRGSAHLRKSGRKVSSNIYSKLWQSPLHQDVFAVDLEGYLLKIDPYSWEGKQLGQVGHDVNFEVINNQVFISASLGIFTFNGAVLTKITSDTPGYPYLQKSDGSLITGQYGVAISYLSGTFESELSRMETISLEGDGFGIQVTLPLLKGENVTGVNIYCTSGNGTELYLQSTHPANAVEVTITGEAELGRPASFRHFSKMPTGKFMTHWQGRLVTADKNMLNFSQSLTYHLTDPRYDYIRMPQSITFVIGVDGGLWVGQVDKVVFLRGNAPDALSFEIKTAQPPVKGSAITLDSEVTGELGEGGGRTAMWLAANGLCIGTGSGGLIEPQSKRIQGISAKSGGCVRFDRRVIAIIK